MVLPPRLRRTVATQEKGLRDTRDHDGSQCDALLLRARNAPDHSPTPVVAPTPSASTPTESPQEREERLAYEGAEKAYRTFITEYTRVVRASDRPHVTRRCVTHATGDYLKAYSAFIKQRRK